MRHGGKRASVARLAIAAIALAGATVAAGPLTAIGVRGALAANPATAEQGPVSFVESFTGRPSAPEPWRPDNWDITYHLRDVESWASPNPVAAHHGPDCSAAPATHEAHGVDRSVYLCNDHLMTALDGGSYGLIYLTPNHMVDFSAGEAVIKFDLSTLRSSPRDWVDIWITPYEDQVQLPLQDWLPDLNGEPRRAVHVNLDFSGGFFNAAVIKDFKANDLRFKTDAGYETVLTPSAVRRDTFELRISRTGLKFGMPDYNLWWFDNRFSDLGWDRGVVQFGHHSYEPTKCDDVCGPGTWHWDNVSISPAVPFTMIKADRRYVAADTEPDVTFAMPAPANSHLRFAGIGDRFDVSFDGGASWQQARHQQQKRAHEEHFKSFWLPVPEGTQQVRFRGRDFHVNDLSIWSLTPIGQAIGGTCGTDGACPHEGSAED